MKASLRHVILFGLLQACIVPGFSHAQTSEDLIQDDWTVEDYCRLQPQTPNCTCIVETTRQRLSKQHNRYYDVLMKYILSEGDSGPAAIVHLEQSFPKAGPEKLGQFLTAWDGLHQDIINQCPTVVEADFPSRAEVEVEKTQRDIITGDDPSNGDDGAEQSMILAASGLGLVLMLGTLLTSIFNMMTGVPAQKE